MSGKIPKESDTFKNFTGSVDSPYSECAEVFFGGIASVLTSFSRRNSTYNKRLDSIISILLKSIVVRKKTQKSRNQIPAYSLPNPCAAPTCREVDASIARTYGIAQIKIPYKKLAMRARQHRRQKA